MRQFLVVSLLVALAIGCGPAESPTTAPADSTQAPEVAPQPLSLAPPLRRADIEISGLTWYGDTLIVLPQYPSRVVDGSGQHLYGLPRSALRRAVTDSTAPPLTPVRIPLTAEHIDGHAADYEGCEAIAVHEDHAYVLIEGKAEGPGMQGHLFHGRVAPGLRAIHLNGREAQPLPQQAALTNMSYEALVTRGDTVVPLFEANGARVNETPEAYRFTSALEPLGPVPFPTLEYRLTDATALGPDRRFWVINYFYPGDRKLLRPATDSLARRFGVGATHQNAEVVERLVEYRYTPRGIERTGQPPLWLTLTDASPRNWEGLARFGDGFLVATDRFPSTLLAYVPDPSAEGDE